MEPKFIVGPLFVGLGNSSSGGRASVWYDDGDLAADVFGNLGTLPDPTDPVRLANLFAAAPELYEALSSLVESEMPSTMTGSIAQRWEDACAALKKARGE